MVESAQHLLAGGMVRLSSRVEMVLALLQALAHDRRQAQMAPGGRQAAEFDHPDEDPDVLEQRQRRGPLGAASD